MYGDILCNLNRERNPLTSMLVAGGMCADRNNVSYAQRLETSCVHACTHACLHASRCVGMAEQGGLYNMCACVMPPPTQNDRESGGVWLCFLGGLPMPGRPPAQQVERATERKFQPMRPLQV